VMRLILIISALCLSSPALTQVISRQVLASSGWIQGGDAVNFSASLGQSVSGSIYSPLGHLRQGFQQPNDYEQPIEGCLDSAACNYNEEASVEDDSCDYVSCLIGCTEPDACNFDPLVIADDGSCDYSCCPGPGCCDDEGMHWDEEQQTCVITLHGDLDFDLCVGLSDLLEFLAVYGQCAEE